MFIRITWLVVNVLLLLVTDVTTIGYYQPFLLPTVPYNITLTRSEMGYDSGQFRLKIRQVLKSVGLWTPEVEELLLLTAAVESQLGTYISQVEGPALGTFQMEPNTFNDINNNYLRYNTELADRIKGVIGDLNIDELENDIRAQIIYARLVYLRSPKSIPGRNDIKGLASYWKTVYNTRLGKGEVTEAVKKYNKYVTKEIS